MRSPGRSPLSSLTALGLSAASGALLAACFPPAGLWFLAWVALVPWLAALRTARGWSAALGSWLAGVVFFACLLHWLARFGVSVLALASALLGLWFLLWGISARWTGRLSPSLRLLAVPVLWCGVEWARGLGRFGFTWGWLGYSQSPALWILPVARVAGTLGISFLIALANAVLAEAVVSRMRGEGALLRLARLAAGCGAVALCVFGARAWAAKKGGPSGPDMMVAVIQGSAHGELRPKDVNVPLTPEERAKTLRIYHDLARQAARDKPVLVVWPESVLPGIPDREPWIADRIAETVRQSHVWLLAGGPAQDERGRPLNSAYLYSPMGNRVARYDKVQLVPFGEYVPARRRLPFLEHYNVRDEDFVPGDVHRVLRVDTIGLGPMICFESSFPRISWQLVGDGAQVLVIITNDAWFGRTAAAAQHQQIGVLRAVETNRWVLRAASTGISSIISPDGRVLEQLELFERDWIAHKITLAGDARRGLAWGPAFAWSVFSLSFVFLLAAAFGRERSRPGARRRARTTRAARPKPPPRRPGRAAPR